jgi:putative FmdB family regulatory protein
MPLYDYRCHKCGETFEVRQKFADALLTVHEGCGGDVERLISTPAFQFKGTGFYLTDYGRGGSNGKSDSKSKSESTKTETKSETKSEAKSDSSPAPAAKPSSDK